MAKSGRKRKRAEKSKTQLRQSIKLPKGLNVTNAEVTSKKITVQNQLKTKDGEDDRRTRKKIGIHDLMHKLNSNGTSIKLEGLEGIAELLKSFPELCEEKLSQLMPLIMSMNVQIESKVRIAARLVIQLIVAHVRSDQIVPLSDSIIAYLCCGLSHIDSDVQLDALKLLDIIIESCPGVIANGFKQILPNCLDQVSLKSKDSNRSLSNNVNSAKLTALQWRTQVLQRVLKIVKLMDNFSRVVSHSENPIMGRKRVTQDSNYLALQSPTIESMSTYELANLWPLRSDQEQLSIASFQSSLHDLLLPTWCEAVTIDKKGDGKSNLIQPSVLPTLAVIIHLLVESNQNDSPKLLEHVMKCFPLTLVATHTKKSQQPTNDCCVHEVNLDICFLVLNKYLSYHPQVLTFLSGFEVSNETEACKLAKTLSYSSEMEIENAANLDYVVKQLAENFKHNASVTKSLEKLSTRPHWRKDLPSLNKWVTELPSLIMNPKANQAQFEVVKSLLKRRDPTLLEAFNAIEKFPQEMSDNVWRSLCLFPDMRTKIETLWESLEKSSVSNETKIFVRNVVSINEC